MKKFLATLIAALVVFTSVTPSIAYAKFKGYDEDKQVHSEVDYEDMEFTGYDGHSLRETIENMETKMSDAKNGDDIIMYYEIIIDEIDIFATQLALCNIEYYKDVNGEYAEARLELTSMWSELVDAAIIAVREALKSPCGDALKEHLDDEELVEDFLDYEDMTERELELSVLGNELVQEYNSAMQVNYTVTVDGREWDLASAEMALADKEIDQDTYYTIALEVSKARNKVASDIYARLVNVKNESARINDYENYAVMAYEDLYNRDYTTEDAKKLYDYTKKYVVPARGSVYQNIMLMLTEETQDVFDRYVMTGDELVELTEPYIKKVDPNLGDAFDYLKKYHTYEMDHSTTKAQIGYTTTLYKYGCPFIFNAPDGSYYDIETFIHEFGHYNNSFHNDGRCLYDTTNMDVAEIHSQGLELLMMEYFDEIYGDAYGDLVREIILYNMLCSVIDGCTYDEFQNEVFSYPGEITPQECNRIFRRISTEYGNIYQSEGDEAYDWVQVSHTFESPLYYISYGTSALAALDIFMMAQEDRKDAIEQYMNLTTYGLDTKFCELLETVDLPDIFEEEVLKGICDSVVEYSTSLMQQNPETQKMIKLGWTVIIVALVVIVAIIALIIILIVVHVKKKKRKAAALAEAQDMTFNAPTDTMGSEAADGEEDGNSN